MKDGKFTEGALNRVEAVIRTFRSLPELLDPCFRPDASGDDAAVG